MITTKKKRKNKQQQQKKHFRHQILNCVLITSIFEPASLCQAVFHKPQIHF